MGHNCIGPNYMGHDYMGHNCIGHNCIAHNHVSNNFIDHNCICHNYIALRGRGCAKGLDHCNISDLVAWLRTYRNMCSAPRNFCVGSSESARLLSALAANHRAPIQLMGGLFQVLQRLCRVATAP